MLLETFQTAMVLLPVFGHLRNDALNQPQGYDHLSRPQNKGQVAFFSSIAPSSLLIFPYPKRVWRLPADVKIRLNYGFV